VLPAPSSPCAYGSARLVLFIGTLSRVCMPLPLRRFGSARLAAGNRSCSLLGIGPRCSRPSSPSSTQSSAGIGKGVVAQSNVPAGSICDGPSIQARVP
jgi:hypothetical protein